MMLFVPRSIVKTTVNPCLYIANGGDNAYQKAGKRDIARNGIYFFYKLKMRRLLYKKRENRVLAIDLPTPCQHPLP